MFGGWTNNIQHIAGKWIKILINNLYNNKAKNLATESEPISGIKQATQLK